jgi:CRISPR-associated protein Csx14
MITVNLDPFNPGQVLACCGLFELSELLSEGGRGWFYREGKDWRFSIETPLSLTDVMAFLKKSGVEPIGEQDPRIAPLRDREREEVLNRRKCPVILRTPKSDITLSWWWNPILTDDSRWAAGAFKGWGGQVSHVELLREFMGRIPDPDSLPEPERIFEGTLLCKTSFGFDSRGCWTTRDLGYSSDEVYGGGGKIRVSPAVEVLAFIALQTFRPRRGGDAIEYYLWRWPLPVVPARFALPGVVKADLVGFRAEVKLRGTRGAYKCFKEARILRGWRE